MPRILGRLEYEEDTFSNFHTICDRYGFVSEAHKVVTSDGYINTLHRVYQDHPYDEVFESAPRTLDKPGEYSRRVQKPIIVMIHGLEDSADGWVLNGKDKSPAFLMAQKGYDVWIPNARGNYYSRGHVSLNATTDAQYWDFTIGDIALEDMPAFIKFIRWKT